MRRFLRLRGRHAALLERGRQAPDRYYGGPSLKPWTAKSRLNWRIRRCCARWSFAQALWSPVCYGNPFTLEQFLYDLGPFNRLLLRCLKLTRISACNRPHYLLAQFRSLLESDETCGQL